MKRMFNRLIVVLSFLAFVVGNVSAQTPSADPRFKDYPIKLRMPTAGPDLATCKAQEYYKPSDFHLLKYVKYLHGAGEHALPTDFCVVMTTTSGPRSVMLEKGTLGGWDAAGNLLYHAGCGNVIFSGIPMLPPTPPPARVITSPPPAPTPRAPWVPRVRPVPAPVYTQPPAKTIEKEETLNVGAHVGIGGLYGWWKETYQCDNPNKCDADQMHQTAALYLTGGGHIGRAFFEGSASIWDKDYKIRFDDPVAKRRDKEETNDVFWTAEGGYEHPLSDNLRLRAGLRMDFYRVHDHYFAPRETSIEQDYKTFGFMGGVRGGDDTAGYVVEGFYEPWGNRDRTGTQAGFPDSHDTTQSAKAYGFDGHVDFGVAEHLGVFVGAGWTHRSSYRPGPASNAGNELPNLLAVFGGVRVHF